MSPLSGSMRAATQLALLGAAAAAGISGAVFFLRRARRDPRERERRRRAFIARHGRMGDGHVTDVSEQVVYYSYSVRGVDYTASQEISELRDSLPEVLESVIGPVTLKFLPGNPGNSIVVSEDWIGIRVAQRRVLLKRA